jgi:hypothetical protein
MQLDNGNPGSAAPTANRFHDQSSECAADGTSAAALNEGGFRRVPAGSWHLSYIMFAQSQGGNERFGHNARREGAQAEHRASDLTMCGLSRS